MTVERRPRQFLAVWTDDGQAVKGSTFEESLFVDGAFWKNELTTVPPEQFSEFGELFSSDLQAQIEQLASAHKTALDEKEAALTAANATIAALEARLERLLTALPFNPREISVAAFKARLFSVLETEDVVRLYAAQPDSTLEQIAATITTWDHAYSIRLDSVELLNPLGYLVAISLLTSDEVAFLRRDCTLPEAFVAPI